MIGILRGFGRAVVTGAFGLAGCTTILGIPDPTELEPNSGTGGGSIPCIQLSDCPPPANECVTATCLNNTCGTMNVPQGTKTPTQVEGDCMINRCTGTGESETIDDDTDPGDDMKECTTDTCVGGTTMHTNVNSGTACAENGGSVCNNAGACVKCITNADCTVAGETCQNGNCNPPGCANAMKDGNETDLDCGGPDCNPCGNGQTCAMDSDCMSNHCVAGTCAQSLSSDVLCGGGEQCPLAGDGACCWSEEQDSGFCVTGPEDMDNCDQSQQGGNTRIECQTDAECGAGLRCCGDRAQGNFGPYYYQVTCLADCDDVTLCATQGAGATECPMVNCQGQQVQGQCNPSQLLPPGYLVCGCP